MLSLTFFGSEESWQDWYPGFGDDPITFVWLLHWWPFAIAHHLNPFISNFVWFPEGFNLMWATSVPLPALLVLPLTISFGPVVSYDVLTILAPAVAAWTAFFLLRDLTRHWFVSLLGGYLFGFSSYEIGHLLGHLNLDQIFLVPIAVLLGVQRFQMRISRLQFISLLTVVLTVQFGCSIEILATLCVSAAASWASFYVFFRPGQRRILRSLAVEVWLAAFASLVLTSPMLFYLQKGSSEFPDRVFSPTQFSADLLNYVVPTIMSRFGSTEMAFVSHRFTSNVSEQGAYLGAPLIMIVGLYAFRHIHIPHARALLLATAMLGIMSLGPWLHLGGIRTPFPLPWALASRLPLIHSALPIRFTMYVSLATAIIAALWAVDAKSSPAGCLRILGLLCACITIIPNELQWDPWPRSAFFTPKHVRQTLGVMPNVIVLPFASIGPSMALQLNSGLAFTQSGGYVGLAPTAEQDFAAVPELSGNIGPDFKNDVGYYCQTHRVNFILLTPGVSDSLSDAIRRTEWPSKLDQGVTVVKVPDLSRERYRHIAGDYWPSLDVMNWMGKQITVTTNGSGVRMIFSGNGRPIQSPVHLTVTNRFNQSIATVSQSHTQTIELPPNSVSTITADRTFVPDAFVHNGDVRELSVSVVLVPEP